MNNNCVITLLIFIIILILIVLIMIILLRGDLKIHNMDLTDYKSKLTHQKNTKRTNNFLMKYK